jgi:hypothetical protein
VINPRTGASISKETLEKAFAEELQNGMAQMDLVCATAMAHQIKAGNTTMMIWFSKKSMGLVRQHVGRRQGRQSRGEGAHAAH